MLKRLISVGVLIGSLRIGGRSGIGTRLYKEGC